MVSSCDVVIVGAGPAGSAAAIHAARAGWDTVLIDAARFPRDKTCGDGLTPRAIHALSDLGIAEDITHTYTNRGLKLHGFGGSVTAAWPDSSFGTTGSAMPRKELDALIARHAEAAGATFLDDTQVTGVVRGSRGEVAAVTVREGGVAKKAAKDAARDAVKEAPETEIRCRWLIVADGVRSTVGTQLGRTWHRGQVYGIAARAYAQTPLGAHEWIHSDVELRDATGAVQPGYGWIFPLGDDRVNLGAGALSTLSRPAKVNTKRLLRFYADTQSEAWQLGELRDVASASLPMGGAVSTVAGPNWALIGDAAACVNPLNGEGIDYGLETAAMAVTLIGEMGTSRASAGADLTNAWPQLLRDTYGEAFALARTAARLLTYPQFLPVFGPVGFKLGLMPAAARLMGNLVTEEDRDLIARVWRLAGKGALVGTSLAKKNDLWGE